MRFVALATDYDETLADDGRVTASTLAALERLKASGRRLLLVTGRELTDLRQVFPRVGELCDAVVAENGAVLWLTSVKEERLLGEPPPPDFAKALKQRKIPVSVGRVIVATREPHEGAVLEEIRRQGLELQVIFNKGAVMVLPSGVNKGTGLAAALGALGLSPRNCVACGDAENDHAFLAEAELGVAVQNALPKLRERADVVTRGAAGSGVAEVIEALLDDDGRDLSSRSRRRSVLLGDGPDGSPVHLPPSDARILFAGPSGAGKSTAAKGFIERLIGAGYQCCILDPEGDYEEFSGTLMLGDGEHAPTVDEAMQALAAPGTQLVLNLLGIKLADRPAFFGSLMPRLQELRARTGRPHWLVIDEAHHLLPASWQPADVALAKDLGAVALITMAPHDVARPLLDDVDQVVAVGADAEKTLADFCAAVGDASRPRGERPGKNEALLWTRGAGSALRLKPQKPRAEHHRHSRKYAQGELAPDRSFWFRGPEQKLKLRAQNLTLFAQIADGVDEDTWLFHLREGDYSRWFREFVKDEELAAEAEAVESDQALSAEESRSRITTAIHERYTLGGSAPVSAPS